MRVVDESGDAHTGTVLATLYLLPAGSDASTGGTAVNPTTHDAYVSDDIFGADAGGTLSVISSRAVPAATGVVPPSGPIAGGTTVTITGTGFTDATKVTFGNVPATSFRLISDTQITAVAPPQASGVHNIYVTTPARPACRSPPTTTSTAPPSPPSPPSPGP